MMKVSRSDCLHSYLWRAIFGRSFRRYDRQSHRVNLLQIFMKRVRVIAFFARKVILKLSTSPLRSSPTAPNVAHASIYERIHMTQNVQRPIAPPCGLLV